MLSPSPLTGGTRTSCPVPEGDTTLCSRKISRYFRLFRLMSTTYDVKCFDRNFLRMDRSSPELFLPRFGNACLVLAHDRPDTLNPIYTYDGILDHAEQQR